MNKTRATEILTALVNEGINVSMVSLHADEEDIDTDYAVTIQMPYGSTIDGLRPAQRVLDGHNATLMLPSFSVVTDEEVAAQREATERIERAHSEAEAAMAEAARNTEEAMASAAAGGRSGDFPPPDRDET